MHWRRIEGADEYPTARRVFPLSFVPQASTLEAEGLMPTVGLRIRVEDRRSAA
jgi:hypothetical protein